MSVAYDNFPEILRLEKAWVNVRQGSKVPYQTATRRPASPAEPDTWSSYKDARQAVLDGVYSGLGYVFHNTGVVGIDIDGGYDSDGLLSETAIDVIRACESYTERSISGRGMHILLKGQLPFSGRNNRAGVEIYQDVRYFIVTGDVFIHDTFIENQTAIDYVLAKYFQRELTELRENKNGRCGRIYEPQYAFPSKNCVSLNAVYPPIPEGSRNISLTSLGGLLHSQGFDKKHILKELTLANECACKPPLDEDEVQQIVNSVTRYRRN